MSETATDQLYTATTQPGQPLPVGYTWREAEAQFNQVRRSEAGNPVSSPTTLDVTVAVRRAIG